MKSLKELFNSVSGIVQNTGEYNAEPDFSWFDDLNNTHLAREVQGSILNRQPYTANPTDTPNLGPMLYTKNGKPNISMVLKALAQAMFIQSQRPTLAGIDDVIHKLEKVITDYRDDLDEVPSYRLDLVKTKDPTQMVNNLVYGPQEPNTRLAVAVSDLEPDSSDLDLGDIRVNTNTNSDYQHDPAVNQVNSKVADRVNVVQKSSTSDEAKIDMEELMRDVAIKTAQLAALKKQKADAEHKSFGT